MRITKSQLKRIIKEELEVTLTTLNEDAALDALNAFFQDLKTKVPETKFALRWAEEWDRPPKKLGQLAKDFFIYFKQDKLSRKIDSYVGEYDSEYASMDDTEELSALRAISKSIRSLPYKYQRGMGATLRGFVGSKAPADVVIQKFKEEFTREVLRISKGEGAGYEKEVSRRKASDPSVALAQDIFDKEDGKKRASGFYEVSDVEKHVKKLLQGKYKDSIEGADADYHRVQRALEGLYVKASEALSDSGY